MHDWHQYAALRIVPVRPPTCATCSRRHRSSAGEFRCSLTRVPARVHDATFSGRVRLPSSRCWPSAQAQACAGSHRSRTCAFSPAPPRDAPPTSWRAASPSWEHVAFAGGAPAVVALPGGQIAALVLPEAILRPHRTSGKLRVLATSGPRRSSVMPDVPNFVEQGYRGRAAGLGPADPRHRNSGRLMPCPVFSVHTPEAVIA